MVSHEVVAIVGPQSETSADHVQSMCKSLKMPHIQTHWDPKRSEATQHFFSGTRDSGSSISSISTSTLSVNLYPHPAAISKVCISSNNIINVLYILLFSILKSLSI